MPSVPSSPDLAHLLSHAERRVVRRLAAVLAEEECTVEEWRVLSLVGDGRGHPMSEIAEHALMPAPSLTKLVDRMVADNLVHRRPDPHDRRRVLLHLTARGEDLYGRAAQRVHGDQARLLEEVGDGAVLAALLTQLSAAAEVQATEVRTVGVRTAEVQATEVRTVEVRTAGLGPSVLP